MFKKATALLGWEAAVAFLLTVLLLILINISCENDAMGPATGGAAVSAMPLDIADRWGEFSATILGNSSCKSWWSDAVFDDITTSQSAVEWTYDGMGTLYLKHVNAAFNCCPIIGCDISVVSRAITIVESETYGEWGPCTCVCLFDVDYRITGLSPGKYSVFVDELYLSTGSELLDFEITLKGTGSSGVFVVDRDNYPWGEY